MGSGTARQMKRLSKNSTPSIIDLLINNQLFFRQRRKEFESKPGLVENIIKQGSKKAGREAKQTLQLVKETMGLNYFI